MEGVAFSNTQAVNKNCPVFAGKDNESFQEYKSKLRVCPPVYSKAVFVVFQGKAQPSSTLGSTDTPTLNAVAEHKWLQVNQDLWSGSTSHHIWLRQQHRPEVRGEAARRWSVALTAGVKGSD